MTADVICVPAGAPTGEPLPESPAPGFANPARFGTMPEKSLTEDIGRTLARDHASTAIAGKLEEE